MSAVRCTLSALLRSPTLRTHRARRRPRKVVAARRAQANSCPPRRAQISTPDQRCAPKHDDQRKPERNDNDRERSLTRSRAFMPEEPPERTTGLVLRQTFELPVDEPRPECVDRPRPDYTDRPMARINVNPILVPKRFDSREPPPTPNPHHKQQHRDRRPAPLGGFANRRAHSCSGLHADRAFPHSGHTASAAVPARS